MPSVSWLKMIQNSVIILSINACFIGENTGRVKVSFTCAWEKQSFCEMLEKLEKSKSWTLLLTSSSPQSVSSSVKYDKVLLLLDEDQPSTLRIGSIALVSSRLGDRGRSESSIWQFVNVCSSLGRMVEQLCNWSCNAEFSSKFSELCHTSLDGSRCSGNPAGGRSLVSNNAVALSKILQDGFNLGEGVWSSCSASLTISEGPLWFNMLCCFFFVLVFGPKNWWWLEDRSYEPLNCLFQ